MVVQTNQTLPVDDIEWTVALPPDAPIEMPLQRLETQRRADRWWLRLRLAVQARAGL